VVNLTATDHDAIVARTSHLPHVLASALVNAVLTSPRAGESDFLGTGFRDTTRLASGEAGMWRDIALDNAEAIAAAVEDLQNELSQLRSALNAKDAAALEKFFAQAQSHRADWLKEAS
jgi:prephenate dehydrogenase